MPKTITGQDAEIRLITEVPRDTEDVDASDLERPAQDLLNNDAYLYKRQNILFARLDALELQNAGFRLNVGVLTLRVEPSQTMTYPGAIRISRYGGMTGPVTITALNLPGGVTMTATPNPITGDTADLTVTSTAQAVAGSYDVFVRGEGGGRVVDVRIPTVVTAQTLNPSFDLTGQASVAIDRAQGNKATVPLSLTRAGGFNSQITFDVAQAPAGVSVSFAPATVSGTDAQQPNATIATLTASELVPAGRYTVILRASGGSVARTTSISLEVSAPIALPGTPDYSVSLAYDPGDPYLINGATLTINRSGGYTGPVTLTAAQIPDRYPEADENVRVQVIRYPRILIDGQVGPVTVYGTSARITADAANTGSYMWMFLSGIAPNQGTYAWMSTTVTATDTTGKQRFTSVDLRIGNGARG